MRSEGVARFLAAVCGGAVFIIVGWVVRERHSAGGVPNVAWYGGLVRHGCRDAWLA